MKGSIAFVAHCPEVRENQRVVVVGECPELGGWELGGAVSLRPAPCGLPLWVFNEVEVNLPESPVGVSGGSPDCVEEGGNIDMERVRVSELKFRLLAIPNANTTAVVGDGPEGPDPDNPVLLEPLGGGDFRVVRLVSGLPPADCSFVRERGENTIRVCAEGGGEQAKREVVGISVEWGVPESLQLALLPVPGETERQTEQLQRESEDDRVSLSGPPSQMACPPSSGGAAEERGSRMRQRARPHDNHVKSGVSICLSQAASGLGGSDIVSQRGRGGEGRGSLGESEMQSRPVGEKKMNMHSDRFRLNEVGNDSPDTESDSSVPRSPPLTSTRPFPSVHLHQRHQLEEGRQRAEGSAIPLKRQRSEAALDLAEVGWSPDERSGGVSCEGREGEVCRRDKRQRRLSVSLIDASPLSSEACKGKRGAVDGGKGVVSENGRRGGEGGEVKRNRHGHILCLHGRVRYRCKDCGGKSICEHGRQRRHCKECGGSSICVHGRRRYECKECGGSSICVHGRQRYHCKDCGGKGICEHGRHRFGCKDCGGKSVCEHGRQRSKCKDCGGAGICEHGKLRYFCKDCGGAGICVHRKDRRYCRECKQVSSLLP
uniref:CBM20 domain-containing protein n=1 Tax=Chromera velia CCMP2878 TaxID=1169474 RepID=A0A0G4FN44_9ALVE|eukprot:Cvel_3522.t1-p1 / transcript=Cvel_3522.t1 / gene=Cvel_3522 / organism=Chromera_velia_CCMP2878 / gene_product=Zinc finger protein 283, putative / transcript_product=Zinc finger protein 283, putative / location=Cvel_scaffold143:69482-71278(-) / protein_length=599 / sequence_SO=supercontig / SO=protein_coding / is_pseudo=false